MFTKIHDSFYGLAVGEALGLPVCTETRESLLRNPVTDMRGYSSPQMVRGSWSSATSLSLAVAESLSMDYFSTCDIMSRFSAYFKNWDYSAIGLYYHGNETVRSAVYRSFQGVAPEQCGDPDALDNGALLRILPMAYYLFGEFGPNWTTLGEAFESIQRVCSLTHAHPVCNIACSIYLSITTELLCGHEMKTAIFLGLDAAREFYINSPKWRDSFGVFERLCSQSFRDLPVTQIVSDSNVVSTLESVVWTLSNTYSYRESVLAAVNLGGASDALGALTGGLAGLHDGFEHIPEEWLQTLIGSNVIDPVCEDLYTRLAKSQIQKIFPYIEFFQNTRAENFFREDPTDSSLLTLPNNEDVATMRKFVKAFSDYGLMSYEYMDVLQANNIRLWSPEMETIVTTANIKLTLAVLSAYIRFERFRAGTWAEAIERNIFTRGLRHLAELSGARRPFS